MSLIDEKFPVKDITFHSGRMQGNWDTNEVTTTEGYFIDKPQVNSTTLESVIKYLRNRKTADSESKIFAAVINYLEEYRLLKVENRHSEEESAENEVDSGNTESETGNGESNNEE